jgi:hypothetical protein
MKKSERRRRKKVYLDDFLSALTCDPGVVAIQEDFRFVPLHLAQQAVVTDCSPLDTECAFGESHVLPDFTVEEVFRPYFAEVGL